jgi:hypothetical protein
MFPALKTKSPTRLPPVVASRVGMAAIGLCSRRQSCLESKRRAISPGKEAARSLRIVHDFRSRYPRKKMMWECGAV